MLQKFSDLTLAAYVKVTNFIDQFKKDERGLSGVVVAVLLILIAVLLIAFIWGPLSGMVQEWWATITEQSDAIAPIGGGGE
jgi:flagellin-like protein